VGENNTTKTAHTKKALPSVFSVFVATDETKAPIWRR